MLTSPFPTVQLYLYGHFDTNTFLGENKKKKDTWKQTKKNYPQKHLFDSLSIGQRWDIKAFVYKNVAISGKIQGLSHCPHPTGQDEVVNKTHRRFITVTNKACNQQNQQIGNTALPCHFPKLIMSWEANIYRLSTASEQPVSWPRLYIL